MDGPKKPASPRLTEAEVLKFINWLSSKADDPHVCPTCGDSDWLVGETMVVAPIFARDGSYHLGGKLAPMLTITCANCGHVSFYNAIKAGLVPKDLSDDGDF